MSDISQIDGLSVRRKRESLGLAITDVATTACLSAKQIKQIEEGGMTAFYSESVKLTAARKVAGLLGMTEAQLFGQVTPEVVEQHQPLTVGEADLEYQAPFRGELSQGESSATSDALAITRSESWHVFAQPPEHTDLSEQPDQAVVDEHTMAPQSLEADSGSFVAAQAAEDSASSLPASEGTKETPSEPTNANYLIKILALFLVALAAAALLRQQAGDEKNQANNDVAPAVSPAPEPSPPMPTAQEPAGNAAQASATSTDAASVLPAAGADKSTPAAPSAEPVSKSLPETPSGATSK